MKRVFDLAKAEIGTFEWAEGSNPKVVAYYRDAGHPEVKDDAVAWCAGFVGAMLHRAGLPNTGSLAARSYLKWGEPVDLANAREGDVVVFWRGSRNGWQGHVAFFVRQQGDLVYVLGGNQRDQVRIDDYPAERVLGVRRWPDLRPLEGTIEQQETEMADLKPIEGKQTAGKSIAAVVAGLVVGAMTAALAKWGLALDAETTQALTVVFGALASGIAAYVKSNWLKA